MADREEAMGRTRSEASAAVALSSGNHTSPQEEGRVRNSLAELRSEVRAFYEDYAECLDSEAFTDWPSFFTEDARYEVISRENHEQGLRHAPIWCQGKAMLRDRVTALLSAAQYEPRALRHFIGGVHVQDPGKRGGEIAARANFLIIESLLEREPQILMIGRYLDRLRRGDDGSLKLKERVCVYDNYRIRTTLVIPV